MACTKSFVLLTVLAIAMSRPVTSLYSSSDLKQLKDTCRELLNEIWKLDDVKNDGPKTFEFSKKWLQQNTAPSSVDRELIDAWQAISKGEECSDSSWNHVVLMTTCRADIVLDVIKESLKAYASKCLTHEYVSEKIKSETSGASSVDFINADFIKKYYKDNRDDVSLHVDARPDNYYPRELLDDPDEEYNCCDPDKSDGAAIQAIEQDFAKTQKDAKNEFQAGFFTTKSKREDRVKRYLEEKLFKPCKDHFNQLRTLETEIMAVSGQFEDGQRELLGNLDTEAREILFRFKYCSMLHQHSAWILVDKVAEHFN